MRTPGWTVILAALAYASLGELSYRSERPVRDFYGACVRSPADHHAAIMALAAAVFVTAAVLLALPGSRWRLRTAAGSAFAVLAGSAVGALWFRHRIYGGAECPLMVFEGPYTSMPWLPQVLEYLALAGTLALASLLVGYGARGIRSRVGANTASART